MRNLRETIDVLIQLNLILGSVLYYIPKDVLCTSHEPVSFPEALMRLEAVNEFWLKKDEECLFSVKQSSDGSVTIVITNEKIKMFAQPPADLVNVFEA